LDIIGLQVQLTAYLLFIDSCSCHSWHFLLISSWPYLRHGAGPYIRGEYKVARL